MQYFVCYRQGNVDVSPNARIFSRKFILSPRRIISRCEHHMTLLQQIVENANAYKCVNHFNKLILTFSQGKHVYFYSCPFLSILEMILTFITIIIRLFTAKKIFCIYDVALTICLLQFTLYFTMLYNYFNHGTVLKHSFVL